MHQTERYCVIDKPSGYVVHRTPGAENSPVVLQTLRDQLGQHVFPVHRLDRSTSGCLVMALDSQAAQSLQSVLADSETEKSYLLLCRGHLNPPEGQFDRPLSDENKVKKDALTLYKVLQEFDDYSLVEASIKTGRTHQIRRHFAFERHQIVGDVNHGKGWLNRRAREQYNLHRLFLHCWRLKFYCPFQKQNLIIESDLPNELKNVLVSLN